MFDFLKKKTETFTLGAPVKGKAVPLQEVNDPTFSDGLLGKGVAVVPAEGKVFAPADGVVDNITESRHAIGLIAENDANILLEKIQAAGYDTVTPMLICNTDAYADVEGLSGKDVNPGDDILVIKKN